MWSALCRGGLLGGSASRLPKRCARNVSADELSGPRYDTPVGSWTAGSKCVTLDLTIMIDHNVVDGARAARFGSELRRLIETAELLRASG
jgi:2-oxoacid dehydrogenases acyltransferase (catalytic domain)